LWFCTNFYLITHTAHDVQCWFSGYPFWSENLVRGYPPDIPDISEHSECQGLVQNLLVRLRISLDVPRTSNDVQWWSNGWPMQIHLRLVRLRIFMDIPWTSYDVQWWSDGWPIHTRIKKQILWMFSGPWSIIKKNSWKYEMY
jgi:hypothetical protein